MSDPWRVGRRVPKNVYVGDEVAGQFQREEWAREAVEAANGRAVLTQRIAALEAGVRAFVRIAVAVGCDLQEAHGKRRTDFLRRDDEHLRDEFRDAIARGRALLRGEQP